MQNLNELSAHHKYVSVNAPQLRGLADLWLAQLRRPNDPTTRAQLSRASKSGQDCCVMCSQPFDPASLIRLSTGYSSKTSIKCRSCAIEFVIEQGATV